jgi:hypothetical protein
MEIEQVKVQWDQYSPGSATWEDANTMHIMIFLIYLINLFYESEQD